MPKYYEVNFDGLPGPTHLYGGLSDGNLASSSNKDLISNPKLAALQSLEKIKFLADLGYKQAILPPHSRPNFDLLMTHGFQGSNLDMIRDALGQDPELVKSAFSSSFMWTANAATISPAADTYDAKTHLTIANLKTNFHRSIEAFHTYKVLRKIFNLCDLKLCPPLPVTVGDEGAANHIRFAEDYASPGVELFVYGYSVELNLQEPEIYAARQAVEASMAVIEAHGLKQENVVLAQQNPEAIDAGVFHNDVISTGNLNFFFYHELAFVNQEEVIQELKDKYQEQTGSELICKQVLDKEISLEEAVISYLFNSQILGTKERMILLAPIECEENIKIANYLTRLKQDDSNPIQEIYYMDLKQSMLNGGGPACLRLRVVLSEDEIKNARQEVFYSDGLYKKLKKSIETHYPEKLSFSDIADQKLLDQLERAYQDLNGIFAGLIL